MFHTKLRTHQIQNKIFPLQVFLLSVGHVFSTGSRCPTCAGEECGHVAGLFTKPHLPPGLNLITRIPAGVCNLNVTLLKPHNNHLGKILAQEIKLCFLWKCFWNVVHINATQPMNSLKSWEHPSRSLYIFKLLCYSLTLRGSFIIQSDIDSLDPVKLSASWLGKLIHQNYCRQLSSHW